MEALGHRIGPDGTGLVIGPNWAWSDWTNSQIVSSVEKGWKLLRLEATLVHSVQNAGLDNSVRGTTGSGVEG